MSPSPTTAMPALPVPRIFVSATTADLGTARTAVANALRGIGALAVEQEYFAPPGQPIAAMLEEKIRGCQAVIHIAGLRYGAEDENTELARTGATYPQGRRSYTQLEHDLALQHDKRLYVFLCADGFPYDPPKPGASPEPDTLLQLQRDHRARLLGSSHFRHRVETPDALTALVAGLKDEFLALVEELTQVSQKVDTLAAAHAQGLGTLTAHAEHHSAEIAALRSALESQTRLTEAVLARLSAQPPGADPAAAQVAVAQERGITTAELKALLAHEKSDINAILAEVEKREKAAADDLRQLALLKREALRKLGEAEEAAIRYEKAIGHFRAAAALYDEASESAEWAEVMNLLQLAHWRHGQYEEGARVGEKVIPACERVFGRAHPNTLASLNNLALLYNSLGAYDRAELLYSRTVEARESVLGREHPETLLSLSNLGICYANQGKYDRAENLLLQALEARERVLGREHPNTLSSVNSLASIYYTKADYIKARPLLLRALEAQERVLGREHPDTLSTVNNLAGLYCSQRAYDDAEPLFLRALQAQERVLGPEHPTALVTTNNLAALYDRQGAYAKAEPLYLRTLAIRERVLGLEHPDTLDSLNNLAVLYKSQGAYGKAEPLYLRALEAQERLLGREHPDTCLTAFNLAMLYESTKQTERVATLARQAYGGWLAKLGPEHEWTKLAAQLLTSLDTAPPRPTFWARVQKFFGRR